MRKTCVGVVLCGWLGVFAGCSEIASTPSDDVDLVRDEPAADALPGGQTNAQIGKSDAKPAEETVAAADQPTNVAAPSAPVETVASSKEPGDAAAAPKPADAPKSVDAPKPADASKPADAPRPAAAAADGHLAPQQVATGGDGRATNITFDNVKFPMDDPKSRMFKRELLTESIEKLSGTRVRVRGFILPGALEEFSNFVLVRDNQECCFGPGSAIYDSMMVDMTGGKTVKFTTRPITVEGVFEIKELIGPDKKHWSIYRLTATKVE